MKNYSFVKLIFKIIFSQNDINIKCKFKYNFFHFYIFSNSNNLSEFIFPSSLLKKRDLFKIENQ